MVMNVNLNGDIEVQTIVNHSTENTVMPARRRGWQMGRHYLAALLASAMPLLALAQPSTLEWQAAVAGPAGNGPSIASQSVTMQFNTNNPTGNTFTASSPATVTTTVTLSNQQYALTTAESPLKVPMAFGSTSTTGGLAPVVGAALYQSLSGIGTPTNAMFTSLPTNTPGTGISTTANGALQIFITTRPLANAGLSTSGRYYYGDLTFSFSTPLSNPVFHISGLGGSYTSGASTLGFTTELELDTGATPGVALSKVSGTPNFSVTGNAILNTAANPGANCTSGIGACGSVLATGTNISSIKLRVYLRGDGVLSTWQAAAGSGSSEMTGDAWFFGGVSALPPADMSPVLSNLPTAVQPGGVYPGLTLTCSNAGPFDALNASCVPTVSSGAISALSCIASPPATVTPATPITCTFTYTAPGAQGGLDTAPTDITFTGTTGSDNDSNGGTSTTLGNNKTSASVPMIDALDNGTVASPFATAISGTASTTPSVLGNDTLSLAAATTSNVTVTPNGTGTFPAGGSALTVNADGTISIPASALAGDYTVPYQICTLPATLPASCDTAIAYVKVDPAPSSDMSPALSGIPAVMSPGQSFTGANQLTLTCTNGGVAAADIGATCVPTANAGTVSNITCTPTQPTLATVAPTNTIVCKFDYVAPTTGAPAGGGNTTRTSITFTGTTGAANDGVGGTGTGGNNSTTAAALLIDAVDDTGFPPVSATAGGTTASVLANDQVGTVTATTAGVPNVSAVTANGAQTCTPGPCTALTLNPSGTITVPPGATPGTYSIPYTICSSVTATACDTATATVVVADDTPDMVSSVTCTANPAVAGALVSCSVVCANVGGGAAVGATCSVSNLAALPPGAEVVCPNAATPVTLAAGSALGCTVIFTAPATGPVVVNAATSATNELAAKTANNPDVETLVINPAVATPNTPDMVSTISCSPTPGVIGGTVSCTATCQNVGTSVALGATCAIDTAAVPGAPVPVCSPASNVVPGAALVCTVAFTPAAPGVISLPTSTTATNEPAAQQTNNPSSADVPVNAAPPAGSADMVSSVSCAPNPVIAGASVTCTVSCKNVGDTSASNAFCTVPNAATLPGSPSVAACPSGQTVAAGASLTCPITFIAPASGVIVVKGGTGASNDVNGSTAPAGGNNASEAPLAVNPLADLVPAFSNTPTAISPGQVFSGANQLTLRCTNAGPNEAAAGSTCMPSANVGTISNILCTPAQPTASTVAVGAAIVCAFDYTAPDVPGGINTVPTAVQFTGITGAGNDSNGGTTPGGNNSVVLSVPLIDAVNDGAAVPLGTVGSINVLTNDSVGAPAATTGNVVITVTTPATPGSTFDPATGDFTVPATALTGSYSVTYQICTVPAVNPAACDTATATLVVGDPSDMAVAISGLPAAASPGAVLAGTVTCTNVAPSVAAINPSCNATAGTPAGAVVVVSGACTPTLPLGSLSAAGTITCPIQVTMPGAISGADVAQMSVGVNATTGAANDSNPLNNAANTTIAIVDALDDATTVVNGTAASINVLSNDTVGASAASLSAVAITVVTPPTAGATFDPATGIFSVPATAANGTYTVSYRITTTPSNVPAANDIATASITVGGSPDLVTTAMLPPVAPAPGSPLNATVTFGNLGPAPATNVTVTLQMPVGLSGVSPSNGGVYNATTGLVTWPVVASVPANTPAAGAYTVTFLMPGSSALSVASNASTPGTETSVTNNASTAQLIAASLAVPTMSEFGLLLMLLCIGMFGACQSRRTRQV
jgi:hypothetical protein